MIERPTYVEKMAGFRDKRLVKIVTGIRRCGKSTLLSLFQEHLRETGVGAEQIQSINLEALENQALADYGELHRHIKRRLVPKKMNYLFLDEIQNVADFEKAVSSLFLKDNVDIYLTGSNSRILAGQWATKLAGRSVAIRMFPFSFKEYMSAFPGAENREEKFRDYLVQSSFPYALELGGRRELVQEYLRGLYSTVILKDVVENKKIADVKQLEYVIKFMFNNIGSEVSVNKIRNTFVSDGRKITAQTIEGYLTALQDCFLLYQAQRYDIKGRELLKTNSKYYLVDIGLRSFLLGRENADFGHILENIVYLELCRRGYEAYVGKIGDAEVDFIARRDGKTEYYQVSQTVMEKTTLERELRPLDAIKDHNPKYLLTMDYLPDASFNGIQALNILDWLLDV
jgi:predicted AAA+ superfamily ATPase